MTAYECPLCKSAISRELYDRVLRIDEARTAEQVHREAVFKAKTTDFETHRHQIIAQATAAARKQIQAQAARERSAERDRYSRQLQQAREELRVERARRTRDETTWKERLAQLQRKAEDRDRAHFGPDGEDALVAALTAAFAAEGDKIEHH